MGFYLNVEGNKIINCSNEQHNSSTVKSYSVEEQIYYDYMANPDKYIVVAGKIEVDSNFVEEQAKERAKVFAEDFFPTSLGYIRRKVSMATGETKDFLSDLLPTISLGVNMGKQVQIITYSQPDFYKEFTVEYLESLQEIKIITPEFIGECAMQVANDFLPEVAPEQVEEA